MSKKSNIYAMEKMAQQIASAKEAHERSAGRKISHATFLRTLRSSYDISNADYQKVRTGRNYSTADFIIALYETHKISPHKLFFGRDWNLVANLLSHPNYDPNVVIRYLLSASDSCGNTLESIQNRDASSRPDGFTDSVGFRFEQIREFCGLNFNQAAKILGCSYVTVQRNERNYDDLPTVNYLTLFCEKIIVDGENAPMDYLLLGGFASLPAPIRGILDDFSFEAQVKMLAGAITYLDRL